MAFLTNFLYTESECCMDLYVFTSMCGCVDVCEGEEKKEKKYCTASKAFAP